MNRFLALMWMKHGSHEMVFQIQHEHGRHGRNLFFFQQHQLIIGRCMKISLAERVLCLTYIYIYIYIIIYTYPQWHRHSLNVLHAIDPLGCISPPVVSLPKGALWSGPGWIPGESSERFGERWGYWGQVWCGSVFWWRLVGWMVLQVQDLLLLLVRRPYLVLLLILQSINKTNKVCKRGKKNIIRMLLMLHVLFLFSYIRNTFGSNMWLRVSLRDR